MTTAKVALSIAADVLDRAREQVARGRAKSLSAFASEALDAKVRQGELAEILDAMDAQHGKPNQADRAWAKRVLGRSSSTRAR